MMTYLIVNNLFSVPEYLIESTSTVELSLKGSNAECFLCKMIMKQIDNELKIHEVRFATSER